MSRKLSRKRQRRKGGGSLDVKINVATLPEKEDRALPEAVLSKTEEVFAREPKEKAEEDISGDLTVSKSKKGGFFAGFFNFFSSAFFLMSVVAFGLSAYFIFLHGRSGEGVTLKITLPKEIYAGAPFEVRFEAENAVDKEIYEPKVWLDLPEGFSVVDFPNLSVGKRDGQKLVLNNFKPNEKKQAVFRVIAVASMEREERSREDFEVVGRMTYALARSSELEVSDSEEVVIKGSAVGVGIKKPEFIVNDSIFEIDLNYKNVSNFDFEDAAIEIKYPERFKFVSASVTPTSLNNYWKIGGLRTGAKGKITIMGTLRGAQGVAFDFPVVITTNIKGVDYPIGSEATKAEMASSLLGLQVETNGKENYVAKLGEVLKYTVRYINSSGIVLKDVTVAAAIRGDMVDFTSLEGAGKLDSTKGAVIWDSRTAPALAEMQPGAVGELSFSIKLPNKYPINRFGDKNFVVKVSVEASSPSVPYYVSGDQTSAEKEVVTKVAGYVSVESKGFYRDSGGSVVNEGELPPTVGKATQYSVHWIIRNFSTDVSGVTVSAPMAQNAFWKGVISENGNGTLSYNEETREVVWEVPKIQATKGVANEPLEAVFRIEGVPDASDVGKFQELMGTVRLKAMDDFTGEALSNSDLPLSTNLVDDVTVGPGMGVVVSE